MGDREKRALVAHVPSKTDRRSDPSRERLMHVCTSLLNQFIKMDNCLGIKLSVEEETRFQPEHSQLVLNRRLSLPKIPANAKYCICKSPSTAVRDQSVQVLMTSNTSAAKSTM